MERFKEFLQNHLWACVLVAAGIVITILLLTIGFFKTLLLVVIVGACLYLGNKLDKNGTGSMKESVGHLFHKKDEGDQ